MPTRSATRATFRCGHPATPENSQRTGSANPPRCRICYRAYMAKYMRETGRNAGAPPRWRYGPYLSKGGPALPSHEPDEQDAARDRQHVRACLEQGGFTYAARLNGQKVTIYADQAKRPHVNSDNLAPAPHLGYAP